MGNRLCALAVSALAVLILSSRASFAQEEEPQKTPVGLMTLEQMEQLALQHNPTLTQAAADAEAASGRAEQAGAWPNPTIGYTGQQIGSQGRAGQQGMFVDQPVITGNKLGLSRAAGLHEANSLRWTAAAQRYRVVNTVRIRYYRALAAHRLVQVENQQIAAWDRRVGLAKTLLAADKIEEGDLYAAQLEIEQLKGQLASAQVRHLGYWRQLVIYAGRPDIDPAALEDVLDKPRTEFDYAALVPQILAESPDLQFARSEVARYQTILQRQLAELIPNLDLQGGTQYDFGSDREQGMAQLGITIPLWDRNRGAIREAQATLQRARAEVFRTELAVRQRVSLAFRRYQMAIQDVRDYRERLLPHSEKLTSMRAESLRKGKGQWSDLMDAQRNLHQLQRDYVQRLLTARRSEVLLEGFALLGGLDLPSGPPADPGESETLEEGP